MLLGYGLEVASSTYCLIFFFTEHSLPQNVVLLVYFFSGLILMVISFIMGLIKSTTHANSIIKGKKAKQLILLKKNVDAVCRSVPNDKSGSAKQRLSFKWWWFGKGRNGKLGGSDERSCVLEASLFLQVINLRHQFFHSSGLVEDRRAVVPTSGFSFSAQQMWKIIKENKDLELPIHKFRTLCISFLRNIYKL